MNLDIFNSNKTNNYVNRCSYLYIFFLGFVRISFRILVSTVTAGRYLGIVRWVCTVCPRSLVHTVNMYENLSILLGHIVLCHIAISRVAGSVSGWRFFKVSDQICILQLDLYWFRTGSRVVDPDPYIRKNRTFFLEFKLFGARN